MSLSERRPRSIEPADSGKKIQWPDEGMPLVDMDPKQVDIRVGKFTESLKRQVRLRKNLPLNVQTEALNAEIEL